MRLHITAMPTMPAAFVLILLTCASTAGETGDAADTGVEGGKGAPPALSLLMFGSSLAESVHNGNSKSAFRHRFSKN